MDLDIYFIHEKIAYRPRVIGFTGSFARSPPEQQPQNIAKLNTLHNKIYKKQYFTV